LTPDCAPAAKGKAFGVFDQHRNETQMKFSRSILCGLFLLVLSAPATYCCSCNTPSLRQSLKKAKAVFVGTVLEVGNIPQVARGYEGSKLYPIKFRVTSSWKGIKTSEIVILSNQLIVCGFIFQTGEKYLVYAYDDDRVVLNGCARSGKVESDNVSKDLARLKSRWFRVSSYMNPF
jgi:hypothetical protein